MRTAPIVVAAALAATALTALPAAAQTRTDCPALEDARDRGVAPLELRIGDLVLRTTVSTETDDAGESTRVEGRVVGCEREQLIGEADAAEPVTVLRLLRDLRLAFDVATDEAGCVRARVDVQDTADRRPDGEVDGPLTLRLCGLPGR